MKSYTFVCISASNVQTAQGHSASTRACEIIADTLQAELGEQAHVEIIPLLDYEMFPCVMCGACLQAGICTQDEGFNSIYDRLLHSDGFFLVCPHYAPIPSKVMILLEKLEEIAYLNYCANREFCFPWKDHPAGIVAHGGMTDSEETRAYYAKSLLEPLSNALASIQMKVVGVDEQHPKGVAFGVKEITLPEDSIFVKIDHDWDEIRQRIVPLAKKIAVLAAA